MNQIVFFLAPWMSGREYLWTDVCGQWIFLTGLRPDLFLNARGKFGLDAPTVDIYLDDSDKLRVFTQGYGQEDYDFVFGVDIAKTTYAGSLDMAEVTAAAYNTHLEC